MIDAKGIIERAAARGREHAAALLRARSPKSQRTAPFSPVQTPEDAVRRIADDMIDLAGATGAAEEVELLNRGWSPQALRKYGAPARDLANCRAVRRLA